MNLPARHTTSQVQSVHLITVLKMSRKHISVRQLTCLTPAVLLIASLIVACNPLHAAQQCHRQAVVDRPTIGLALGGGGARGGAHVGVIRALEELNVPVDYIAGTSMGSIVGGMMAVGMSSGEMKEIITGIDWIELFKDDTEREDLPYQRKRDDDLGLFGPKLGIGEDSSLLPQGFIAGQKILVLFESVTTSRVQPRNFDELPIPFRAVAADIATGDPVVINHSDLALAMRASMSVPAVFNPVPYGDHLLVDGGIANNLPVDVVRDMGADIVIAINVGSPLLETDKLTNALAITSQLSTIMVQKNTQRQIATLTASDVLITPQLGDEIGAGDFSEMGTAAEIGYAAAQEVRSQLAALGILPAAYQAHRQQIDSCVEGPPVIEFVRIDNRSRFADFVIEDQLRVETGQPLDYAALDHDIKQIYGLGFLELVRYEIVKEEGRTGIIVYAYQDSRGTQFIETGLDLVAGEDSSSFNLRVGYLKTDVGKLGGEFRATIEVGQDYGIYSELYQPLDRQRRWIVLPTLQWGHFDINQFNDSGDKIRQYGVNQASAGLGLGYEFGRSGIISAGLRRYGGEVKVNIGEPEPDYDYDGGEYTLSLTLDRMDDRYFPGHGFYSSTQYVNSNESLGADAEFEQLTTENFFAHTWNRHTLIGGLHYNITLDNNAPVYALFRAGGLFNMSGYENLRLSGQNYGLAIASYRFRVKQSGLLPAYAGFSVEYGNVSDSHSGVFSDGIWNGSAYFGYNSPLGPLYAGIGWSDENSTLFFLRLGRIFGQRVGAR
jgi:NTE family protein